MARRHHTPAAPPAPEAAGRPWLQRYLMTPVDGATLAALRMGFGGLMAGYAFFHEIPLSYTDLRSDAFHFTYPFLSWLAPWPVPFMQFQIFLMGVAALGLAVGLFYRFCAIVLFATWTHQLLLDVTLYNNHDYLIALIALLFTFSNGAACASLDRLRGRVRTPGYVPWWNIFLFRFQILVVYFYGALAKLNGDWFSGEPIRYWCQTHFVNKPIIGSFFASESTVWFMAYGGFLFDLLIGFLLWSRYTRLPALIPLLFFHGTNSFLFEIAIFPPLAILLTVIYFEPETPRRWLGWLGIPAPQSETAPPTASNRSRLVTVGITVYVLVQLFLPLRHYVIPGSIYWTEQGSLFAWHMMTREKHFQITFTVTDPATGREWKVADSTFERDLTRLQRVQLGYRPAFVLQYARLLRDRYRELGVKDPVVTVDHRVSLNGRPYLPIIDPTANLAEAEYPLLRKPAWILPLDPAAKPGEYPATRTSQ